MLIYDDIFTANPCGAQCDPSHPIRLLPSCKLRIIKQTPPDSSVVYLKPFLVVAEDISSGPTRKICAEILGKQILETFNLNIKKTLWIEIDRTTPAKAIAATFRPKYYDGKEMIYFIDWRPVMDQEIRIIQNDIRDLSL